MNVYVWIGPTKHAQLASLAAVFTYTGMFLLPFLVYIVYRINSGMNYYLLAIVQSVEILSTSCIQNKRMGEQQCALDTMDLCSAHGRLFPLLRCPPVPHGA